MAIQFEQISVHMINDRMDRYIFIQTHTGIGNPVIETYVPATGHIEILTDTGVLLVTDKDKKILITCFYIDIAKAIAVFKSTMEETVTKEVRKVIKQNMKRNYIKLQNK